MKSRKIARCGIVVPGEGVLPMPLERALLFATADRGWSSGRAIAVVLLAAGLRFKRFEEEATRRETYYQLFRHGFVYLVTFPLQHCAEGYLRIYFCT